MHSLFLHFARQPVQKCLLYSCFCDVFFVLFFSLSLIFVVFFCASAAVAAAVAASCNKWVCCLYSHTAIAIVYSRLVACITFTPIFLFLLSLFYVLNYTSFILIRFTSVLCVCVCFRLAYWLRPIPNGWMVACVPNARSRFFCCAVWLQWPVASVGQNPMHDTCASH